MSRRDRRPGPSTMGASALSPDALDAAVAAPVSELSEPPPPPEPSSGDALPLSVAPLPASRFVAVCRIFAGAGVEYAPGDTIPEAVADDGLSEGAHWRREV